MVMCSEFDCKNLAEYNVEYTWKYLPENIKFSNYCYNLCYEHIQDSFDRIQCPVKLGACKIKLGPPK